MPRRSSRLASELSHREVSTAPPGSKFGPGGDASSLREDAALSWHGGSHSAATAFTSLRCEANDRKAYIAVRTRRPTSCDRVRPQ